MSTPTALSDGRTTTQATSGDDTARFAVIDVETTGLDPHADRVLEIGVSLRDHRFNQVAAWSTLINPHLENITATEIHGITQDMLDGAPTFGEIIDELSEVLNGCVLLAHNASFDAGFLTTEAHRAYQQLGIECHHPFVDDIVCTKEMAGTLLETDRTRLMHLTADLGVTNDLPHSALADAVATGDVVETMIRDRAELITQYMLTTHTPYDGAHFPTTGLRGVVKPRATV